MCAMCLTFNFEIRFEIIANVSLDSISCVIFARRANQPHAGPLGLVVLMNIRLFKIPRSEVLRHPIIVKGNLSRKFFRSSV